jgi:hypothetical protein
VNEIVDFKHTGIILVNVTNNHTIDFRITTRRNKKFMTNYFYVCASTKSEYSYKAPQVSFSWRTALHREKSMLVTYAIVN